ncbi:4'-phosphopantetheinyl transferase superfamily protein [Prochlorococcus sp. MIT 1223]|uniref:4'-phosphopantetheinyl transferase family protein n=1 Tax=Prochlorococcus sp. MIT 1223 TaxID=3096217 RepID=UPI002A74BD2D|nr:4'-phosphopantetheinyl transferase superfamily protein [Prochlorococcus sp. MIT 1223]
MWIYPINSFCQKTTSAEKELSLGLPAPKASQFLFSRGYVRYSLSCIFNIDPLSIPLSAMPGKAPYLEDGWGHISFSHCVDALFIGWSKFKLGVDIERKDRLMKAKELSDRYFTKKEIKSLMFLDYDSVRRKVLKYFVTKEAAIKWQRGSITRDITQWECDLGRQLTYHKKNQIQLHSTTLGYNDWYLSVASKIETSNIIRICN